MLEQKKNIQRQKLALRMETEKLRRDMQKDFEIEIDVLKIKMKQKMQRNASSLTLDKN